MRVYVKLNNGRRFNIPAPIGLVKAVLSFGGLGVSISKRYIPVDQRQYVDCIDFRKLRESLDILRVYRGLKIVDIKNSDGTEITIVV